MGLEVDLLLAGERQERGHLGRQRPDPETSRRAHAIQEIASARDDSKALGASSIAINVAATSRVLTVLLSSVLIAGLAAGEVFAAATPDVGRPAPAGSRRLVVKPAQATPDAPSKSAAAPEVVFDGLDGFVRVNSGVVDDGSFHARRQRARHLGELALHRVIDLYDVRTGQEAGPGVQGGG